MYIKNVTSTEGIIQFILKDPIVNLAKVLKDDPNNIDEVIERLNWKNKDVMMGFIKANDSIIESIDDHLSDVSHDIDSFEDHYNDIFIKYLQCDNPVEINQLMKKLDMKLDDIKIYDLSVGFLRDMNNLQIPYIIGEGLTQDIFYKYNQEIVYEFIVSFEALKEYLSNTLFIPKEYESNDVLEFIFKRYLSDQELLSEQQIDKIILYTRHLSRLERISYMIISPWEYEKGLIDKITEEYLGF